MANKPSVPDSSPPTPNPYAPPQANTPPPDLRRKWTVADGALRIRGAALLPRLDLMGEAPDDELVPVTCLRREAADGQGWIAIAIGAWAISTSLNVLFHIFGFSISATGKIALGAVAGIAILGKLKPRAVAKISYYASRTELEKRTRAMGWLHACHAAGAMLAGGSSYFVAGALRARDLASPDTPAILVLAAGCLMVTASSRALARRAFPAMTGPAREDGSFTVGAVVPAALQRLRDIEGAGEPAPRIVHVHRFYYARFPLRCMANRTWLHPRHLWNNVKFRLFHRDTAIPQLILEEMEALPQDRLPASLQALAAPWLRPVDGSLPWEFSSAGRLEGLSGGNVSESIILISPDGRLYLAAVISTSATQEGFCQVKRWTFFSAAADGALLRTGSVPLSTTVPGAESQWGPGNPEACHRAHLKRLRGRQTLPLTPAEWRERISAHEDATLAALIAAGLATELEEMAMPVR